jgi:hypothetical protein
MRSVADGTGNRPDRAEPVGMEGGRFGRDSAALFGLGDADIRVRSGDLPRSFPISVPGRTAWQRRGETPPFSALDSYRCKSEYFFESRSISFLTSVSKFGQTSVILPVSISMADVFPEISCTR